MFIIFTGTKFKPPTHTTNQYKEHKPFNPQNPRMANLVNMDIIKRVQSQETRYTNWYNTNEPTVQFSPNHHSMEESVDLRPECGNSSPSPPRSPSHPLLGRFPSSGSRARAIARGQWELMEMVRNMPESSYELSLKDLVESQEIIEKKDEDLQQRAVVKSKGFKEEGCKKIGFENKGLFLKMVFPISLRSRKKKKGKIGRNCSDSKVSPPKVVVDGGAGEKDWWKKRFTGSSDSNSSGISNSSGGTTTTTTVSSRGSSGGGSGNGRGGRKINGLPTGCWPFSCSGGRKSVNKQKHVHVCSI